MTRPNSYFERLRRRPKRVKLVTKLGVRGAVRPAAAKQLDASASRPEPAPALAVSAISPVAEF